MKKGKDGKIRYEEFGWDEKPASDRPCVRGRIPLEAEAWLEVLGDQPLKAIAYQREVERFDDGNDSLPDQPL